MREKEETISSKTSEIEGLKKEIAEKDDVLYDYRKKAVSLESMIKELIVASGLKDEDKASLTQKLFKEKNRALKEDVQKADKAGILQKFFGTRENQEKPQSRYKYHKPKAKKKTK